MTIEISPGAVGNAESARDFIRWRGSGIADACRFNEFQATAETAENYSVTIEVPYGTMRHRMNWEGLCASHEPVRSIVKEKTMRNRILAIAAIAGTLGAPIAAQAQSDTVGVVRGSGAGVVIDDADGIAVAQRPAFREYVIRERVPTFTIPDRVIVGGVLPEAGITYYDVPQTYASTPYRYTVVNGRTVLVEPRTRRIVQVVE
jgi:hypothetical protein